MFGKLSISKSYVLIFTGILFVALIRLGLLFVWKGYQLVISLSALAAIMFFVFYLARYFSRRARGEFETVTTFFKLGAMMSVNTSNYREIDSTSLSLEEIKSFAESANKMFRETREARKALRESEETYRSFVERASDGIMIVQNSLVRYINPVAASVVGYTVEELVNFPLMEYFHPSDVSMLLEDNDVRLQGENTQAIFEARAKHKNGHHIDLEVNPGRIMYKECAAVLLVTRDITERKLEERERRKLEEQVQHAQKLESLEILAGGIAHDFNNLLMGIMGNANLLIKELSDDDVTLKRLRAIETSSERAAEFIRQLLAYSGQGKFVVKPLDLSTLVEEMTSLLQTAICKKAELKCNFVTDLPAVEGDPTQIRQVIMNLITNAADAMGDEYGVINVSTGTLKCSREFLKGTYFGKDLPIGKYVCFSVSDTGSGMNDETVSKIFDPFFTTKFTGRGLGLAAVLGIVRGHKGTLKVTSEEGQGTTFSIFLPASSKVAEAPVREHLSDVDWKGEGTILVVDDEPDVREVVKEILQTAGFSVLSARDGVEAVNVFRRNKNEIAAVVLDMTMPNMDGRETFQELRKTREDVRVILSSGYNEQEVTSQFADKQPAGFIQKPYMAGDLVAIVRGVIEGSVKV